MWTRPISLTGFNLYFSCGQLEFIVSGGFFALFAKFIHFVFWPEFFSRMNTACLNVLKLCFDKYCWKKCKRAKLPIMSFLVVVFSCQRFLNSFC